MDPETKKFYEESHSAVQPNWPRFVIGEQVVIHGVTFKIVRINRSNIVLRPLSTRDFSASQVMESLLAVVDSG